MIVSSPTKSLDLFIQHISRLADEDIVGIKFGVQEVDDYLLPLTETDLAFILARPGNAKCMGRGTRVLMYDGSLKNIEDVAVNDKLMGPDSKPRRVLSTTSGYDEMYWIRQKKGGIDYLVNGNHILSLIRSKNEYNKKHGEIKNISVNDILNGPKSFLNRWKGYKVAVDFPEQDQLLDPYFVGLWLGDGTRTKPEITNADDEILNYCFWFAKKNNYDITYRIDPRGNKAYTISFSNNYSNTHGVLPYLRQLNLYDNKHVPSEYMIASRRQRLKLLAGFIDADGSVGDNTYYISQKDESLLRQIKFVADTLGFRTSWNKSYYVNDVPYYRLNISGNLWEIPCLVKRKKISTQKKRRIDQSVNGISIEYHGIDEYFGFELSGDGLYLLEDMTVTHNTSIMTHYSFRAAELHLESQKNKIKYGPPIFVTAEMPIESLMVRSLSKFSGLDSRFLLTGKGNVDWKLVEKHAKDLTDENPIIYMGNSLYEGKRGPIQLEDIEENIHRVVDKIGMPPSLICVDYLQRIVMRKGPADRRLIMSEIVERFKDIATGFRTPILVGSQAGREVDTRTFPVPTTKDGKETGAIEEAADVVLSGFRPIKYWKAGQPVPHSSKGMIVSEELYFLQVLKQRNGEAGSGFWISFDPKVGEFDSLSIL